MAPKTTTPQAGGDDSTTPTERRLYPNTFQVHNVYVDELLPVLTGDEVKTLLFAIRQIVGWNKVTDRISLSQFCNGINGKGGTGLSPATQRAVLRTLVNYGLLLKVAENDPTVNHGAEWGLQFDMDLVDLDGLRMRATQRSTGNAARTAAATAARPPNVGRYPLTSDVTPPLTSDVTPPPNVGREGQNPISKPNIKTQEDISPAPLVPESEEPAPLAVVVLDPCLPETAAEKQLFSMLGSVYATLPARGGSIGRRPPTRFANQVQKDNFDRAVKGLPLVEVQRRLRVALGANITAIDKITAYIGAFKTNGQQKQRGPERNNGTPPDVERENPDATEWVSIV